jgi:hypothetical protein
MINPLNRRITRLSNDGQLESDMEVGEDSVTGPPCIRSADFYTGRNVAAQGAKHDEIGL